MDFYGNIEVKKEQILSNLRFKFILTMTTVGYSVPKPAVNFTFYWNP